MHSIRHWAGLGRCSDLWCVYLMRPPNRTECGSSSAWLSYLRLPPNKVRKNKPQNELIRPEHEHIRSHPRKLGRRLGSDIIKFYNISMRLHFN